MAIINVNSTSLAVLGTAIQDASGGDTIRVAGGPYTGVVNLTSATTKTSELIIESTNYASPTVINGTLRLQGTPRHLTFKWLDFVGTAFDVGSNGIHYPTGNEPLRFDNGRDMKVLSCLFRFWLNGLKFQSCTTGTAEVAYCNFEQICVDPLLVYGVMDNLHEHHNAFIDWRIDPARRNVSSRHPDSNHIRPNVSQVGAHPMANLIIEDNYIDDPSGYAKAFFLNNEQETPGIGFTNAIGRRNHIAIGRYCGIEITGGTGSIISDNLIREYDAGVGETPTIFIQLAPSTGTVSNNVTPRAIQFQTGASSGNFTVSGNVVSATATPSGWTPLVVGVNVGRIPEGAAEQPTQPTTEWSNPPTNTASKDGRVATSYAVGTTPETYGAVLIIPNASVAWTAVSALPTTVGVDVSSTLFWTRTGITGNRNVRVSDPAVNASGSRRYDLIGSPGDAASVYSVAADGVMSGISWGYRENGIASELSSYTGGFTAPAAPPVEAIDPLAADEWESVGSVYELSPGRFTKKFRIIPATGPAHTGVQWDKSDDVWRSLIATGTDGEGATLYQLEPTPGDDDNTVQYGETLNIRLRYAVNQVFSPASTTTKGFTGPSQPAPIDPYDPGDIMTMDGDTVLMGGFPWSIPTSQNRPAKVGQDDIFISRSGDTVTVTLPPTLPLGAAEQGVLYNGARILPDVNNQAVFTAASGNACLVMAWNAAGLPSPAQHVFIPVA
jgi:hypothetical protein